MRRYRHADARTQPGLGHIQPAAMLGRIAPLKPPSEPLGFGGRKGFEKRRFGVRVQIVLHRSDVLGMREVSVRILA
jgi:hypothetical protein